MCGYKIILFLYYVHVVSCAWSFLPSIRISNPFEKRVPPIRNITARKMHQLVDQHGYPHEEYHVTTKDGYILTVFRIPFGKKCNLEQRKKVNQSPVILWHGLLDCSLAWVLNGPRTSLGFILADQCYDVWLPNSRGNHFSRSHTRLHPVEDAEHFWKFSWHEIGIYDVPAVVDFILKKTDKSDLYYFGHSQGTTQFFVFASMMPEYHKKIRAMFALAPVAYMKHVSSVLLKTIVTAYNFGGKLILKLVGENEFLPNGRMVETASGIFCAESIPNNMICKNVVFLMTGYDAIQYNSSQTKAMTEYMPAGAATRQILHYAQGINSGLFRQFDFGVKNKEFYPSDDPPIYDLENIFINISLFYGQNDVLAQPNDVAILAGRLPRVKLLYEIPYSHFNHLDFLYALDVRPLLHKPLLKCLKSA